MDSSGLGSIIAVNKQLAACGGVFACAALKPGVLKIFKVTRADQKMSVLETVSDGLMTIQKQLVSGNGR
jgi:anti-anti-sigma regulatory factor